MWHDPRVGLKLTSPWFHKLTTYTVIIYNIDTVSLASVTCPHMAVSLASVPCYLLAKYKLAADCCDHDVS